MTWLALFMSGKACRRKIGLQPPWVRRMRHTESEACFGPRDTRKCERVTRAQGVDGRTQKYLVDRGFAGAGATCS